MYDFFLIIVVYLIVPILKKINRKWPLTPNP
jgi:hypothetical protein